MNQNCPYVSHGKNANEEQVEQLVLFVSTALSPEGREVLHGLSRASRAMTVVRRTSWAVMRSMSVMGHYRPDETVDDLRRKLAISCMRQ